jgi:hypothetical protein
VERRRCPGRKFEENGKKIFKNDWLRRRTQEEKLHFIIDYYFTK